MNHVSAIPLYIHQVYDGGVRVFICLHVLLGTQLTSHKSTNTDAKGGTVLGVAKARGFRKQKQRRMLTYADVC